MDEGRPWTQAQLAKSSGISLGAIQKVEAGVSWPDWNTVLKISTALDIEADDLFGAVDEKLIKLDAALRVINKSMNIDLRPAEGFGMSIDKRSESIRVHKEFCTEELFETREDELEGILKLPKEVLTALSGVHTNKKLELVLRAVLGLVVSQEEVTAEWSEKSTKRISASGVS